MAAAPITVLPRPPPDFPTISSQFIEFTVAAVLTSQRLRAGLLSFGFSSRQLRGSPVLVSELHNQPGQSIVHPAGGFVDIEELSAFRKGRRYASVEAYQQRKVIFMVVALRPLQIIWLRPLCSSDKRVVDIVSICLTTARKDRSVI